MSAERFQRLQLRTSSILRQNGFRFACGFVSGSLILLLAFGSAADAKSLRPIKDIETERTVLDMYNKAVRFAKEKRHVHARVLLEKAATYDPTSVSPYIHVGLADIYHELGNTERAIREAKLSLKFNGKQKEVYHMLGILCADARRFDEGIAYLSKYCTMVSGARRDQTEGLIQNLIQQRDKMAQFSPESPDYLDQLMAEDSAHQWPRNKVPLKVFIQPDSSARCFKPEFAELAHKAFVTWYKASGKRLSFDFLNSEEGADITVEWTDEMLRVGDEKHEKMKAGLTTTTRGSDRLIKHARIQVRTVRALSKDPTPDDMVKETCLHEVGHALGLNGHSINSADIMYFGNSSRQLPALTKRDKATIARLYQSFPAYPMVGVDTSFPFPAPDTSIPRLTSGTDADASGGSWEQMVQSAGSGSLVPQASQIPDSQSISTVSGNLAGPTSASAGPGWTPSGAAPNFGWPNQQFQPPISSSPPVSYAQGPGTAFSQIPTNQNVGGYPMMQPPNNGYPSQPRGYPSLPPGGYAPQASQPVDYYPSCGQDSEPQLTPGQFLDKALEMFQVRTGTGPQGK